MRSKLRLGELVIQMVSVTFGVLLALWIGNLVETSQEKRDVNKMLQSIANEINFNKRFLESRVGYYEQMVNEMDSLIEQRITINSIKQVPSFKGLNPPLLRKSSFDLALNTGVFKNLAFDKADQIATFYSFQDFYLKMIDFFIERIMSTDEKSIFGKDGENFDLLHSTFKEWLSSGNELISNMDRLLEQLPESVNQEN